MDLFLFLSYRAHYLLLNTSTPRSKVTSFSVLSSTLLHVNNILELVMHATQSRQPLFQNFKVHKPRKVLMRIKGNACAFCNCMEAPKQRFVAHN